MHIPKCTLLMRKIKIKKIDRLPVQEITVLHFFTQKVQFKSKTIPLHGESLDHESPCTRDQKRRKVKKIELN